MYSMIQNLKNFKKNEHIYILYYDIFLYKNIKNNGNEFINNFKIKSRV